MRQCRQAVALFKAQPARVDYVCVTAGVCRDKRDRRDDIGDIAGVDRYTGKRRFLNCNDIAVDCDVGTEFAQYVDYSGVALCVVKRQSRNRYYI